MIQSAIMTGWAHSRFGKSDAPDVESLIAEVGTAALEHSGITAAEVEFVALGVSNNGFSKQGFEAGLVGLAIPGLEEAPAVHVENACATGSAALHAALDFVESGRGHVALAIGAEKMTGVDTSKVGDILLAGSYRPEEGDIEGGFAGVFGRIAGSYFQANGDRSRELAMIAAKNHENGVHNPYGHMRKDLGVDLCNTISEKNPRVAGPLRRTDCSLVSDGAAAIVVMSEEMARGAPRGIQFLARSHSNDIFPLSRRDPTAFEGPRRAWAQAFERSGLSLQDLDLVETHDCFTVAEMIEYEAMGLTKRGEGWKAAAEGWTRKDGKLPVNPSGGLKSRGHPIGATGISQHVMAAMQLMEEAGDMQIPRAATAGVFNMGGAAVTSYVSLMRRTS